MIGKINPTPRPLGRSLTRCGVNNILVVRNDRFGEFLLNIPAFRALKQSFTGSSLTLVVNPYVKELAQSIDFVDGVITWEARKHKFGQVIKFSRELKNKKFDLCVIFNPSKEFNIISFLAAIPIRAGYSRKLGLLLTHKIQDEKKLGLKHEIEYNFDLVRLIGADTQDKTLYLSPQVKDEEFVDRLLADFNLNRANYLVAIHPWTSNPLKQWPTDNFIQLAKSILRDLDIRVLIVGGKENMDKSNQFCEEVGNSIINLTGRFSLRQLAAFFRRCKLLVSNDSGPIHLAAAVNIPVVALFRNMPGVSARRWGPWGDGHIVIEKEKLELITLEEVFDRVKEILSAFAENHGHGRG